MHKWVLERGSHEGDGRCHGTLSTELCFTVFLQMRPCGNREQLSLASDR